MLSLFPSDDYALIAVILGMPLLGAFVNGIWGKRLGKPAVRLMALAAVGVSFVARPSSPSSRSRRRVERAEADDHVRLAWNAWEWMHTTGGRDGADDPDRRQVQRRRS